MADERLEKLASITHGALAGLHGISAAYHLLDEERTKRSWIYVGFHIGALLFDIVSARRHLKDGK